MCDTKRASGRKRMRAKLPVAITQSRRRKNPRIRADEVIIGKQSRTPSTGQQQYKKPQLVVRGAFVVVDCFHELQVIVKTVFLCDQLIRMVGIWASHSC